MLECILPDEIVYCDMTKSETYERDLFSLEPGDYLILGGDMSSTGRRDGKTMRFCFHFVFCCDIMKKIEVYGGKYNDRCTTENRR